jgi:hypothetical protein
MKLTTEQVSSPKGLQRLVLDFRNSELVVRCLYRSQDGAGPSTKARSREVTALVRTGLEQALESLQGAGVEVVGTSGFTTREDILSLPTPMRPAKLGRRRDALSFCPLLQTFVCGRGEERTLEVVDQELDRLISKRASSDIAEDPDDREERWKASVRAYNARQRDEMRVAWCEYHRGQAERLRCTVEPLIAFHEAQVAQLGNLGAPTKGVPQ